MDISTKSTFSRANQLTVLPDGRTAVASRGSMSWTCSDYLLLNCIPANPRKSAPSIKVRFPAETYALAGHTAQLECFAYGKYVSHSEIV